MSSSDRALSPVEASRDPATGERDGAAVERGPLISIGVPTYNRCRSLRRSLESALNQDYGNIEVLVSDDASTDETQTLCREICAQDDRLHYSRQQKNRGIYANLAEVLSRARGDYFMWLSDDDWLDPTYASESVSFLMQHEDYSLVCGKDRYFRGDQFLFAGPIINLPQDSAEERVASYFRRVTINGMLYGIMRRKLLSRLVLPPVLGGDWLLISQIAFFGKTRTLDTISINRSATGDSGDMERHALRMGLTPRQAKNPHLAVAKTIFRDIGWASPTYRSLGTLVRLRLATRSFWGVFSRFCLRYYRSRLNNLLIEPCRRLLDSHVIWRFRHQRRAAPSDSKRERQR